MVDVEKESFIDKDQILIEYFYNLPVTVKKCLRSKIHCRRCSKQPHPLWSPSGQTSRIWLDAPRSSIPI